MGRGCASLPLPSRVILRQVRRALGQRGEVCPALPGWPRQAVWWASCPECPGGMPRGRLGPTARSVCEGAREPCGKGRAGARPRLWVRGTQAKPRGGPPPALPATLPRSTSQSERGPRVRGERGSSLGGASARRHRVAGFVSQAILYFHFRCIS